MLDFQRKWCVSIFDDLKEFEMFDAIFRNADGANPFDTVEKRLSSGEYKSVSDWVKDVNLIFFNVKASSKKGTPTYIAAEYLEKWFAKKTVVYPGTKEEEWMMKFQKVQSKVQRIADMKVKL